MRCAKLRKVIVVLPAEERSERLQAAIEQHLRECPACARFARQMAALTSSLQALPRPRAPEDFTLVVTSRVQARRRKPGVGWLTRTFGVERAAAPLFSPRLAWGAASVLAIALGMGLYVGLPRTTPGLPPTETMVAVNGTAAEGALGMMDEIMLRDRQYSRSYPLVDDPGIELISYSPGE